MHHLPRFCVFFLVLFPSLVFAQPQPNFHEIQIIDSVTKRGVPLVEMETTNHLSFVTDSAGRVAFYEPGMMNTPVFFTLKSHGYQFPEDGFGFQGLPVQTTTGGATVVEIKRQNVAERLYRVTGQGIYRDTVMLGKKSPLAEPVINGRVTGQDSAQRAIYQGKIFWFWGDTNWAAYPLGNFRTTGGYSALPASGGLAPDQGVNITYFTDSDGFTKEMCPFTPSEGVIWIDGLMVVPGTKGRERMLAHYSRRAGLNQELEHGLVVWNDQTLVFDRYVELPKTNLWQFPQAQAFKVADSSGGYYYFGNPFPIVRVRANFASATNPASYEAWSCLQNGSSTDPATARLLRDINGKLVYRWTTQAPPVGINEQRLFVDAGLMTDAETTFFPRDVETSRPIRLHGGSVDWNPWRKRWIMVATQVYGTSLLGEIWYAEAKTITGPWTKARRLITHQSYDFYNPVHHPFFNQSGGQIVYFEGSYTSTFGGNGIFTPRYDYNQIMYRFDLADPRIQAAWVE